MAKFLTKTVSAPKARGWATDAVLALAASLTLLAPAHAQEANLARHPVRLALKHKKPIVVTDLHAQSDAPKEDDPTVAMCKSFRMSERQAVLYLKHAQPISPLELDHGRDWLPCQVSGKASVGKTALAWTVTASGVGKVWLASAPEDPLAMACDGACRRRVFPAK